MAAPPEITLKNLDGKWVISKSLSDSTDPVLALQGIGWLTRKAISLATVTQHLRQYTAPADDNPSGPEITRIDMDQVATGGLKGTTESRNLDWQWRAHSDYLFGDLRARSRWVKLEELVKEGEQEGGELAEDAKFLAEGWDEETKSGEVVDSVAEHAKWTAEQIWGFTVVNGKRMLVRRFVVKKADGKDRKRIRLVYEYAGPVEKK